MRGGVLISCIAVVLRPWTLASLQCQYGARRVLTDQAEIARTKRWGGAQHLYMYRGGRGVVFCGGGVGASAVIYVD